MKKIYPKNILENRIYFKKKYDVKTTPIKPFSYHLKYMNGISKYVFLRVDNLELFKDNKNRYFLLNSPDNVSDKEEEVLFEDRWKKIDKLHSDTANTYMKYLSQRICFLGLD